MLKGKMKDLTKISPTTLILIGVASALLSPFPLLYAPYFLTRYYVTILQTVLMWMTLSISWYFFSGFTKYIALGSAVFTGTGLYFTATYLNLMTFEGYPILPFPVIVLLAGSICFVLALAIGLVTLRLKGIYFAIATFGMSELVAGVIRWWQSKAGMHYIIFIPSFGRYIIYYSILTTALAILLLTTFLRRSKFGLALKMMGECEDAAAHFGVNTTLFKVLGFAISAMCMGLMGGSYAIRFPSINIRDAFSVEYSFVPVVMVLLGGVGTAYGPIIGAVTLSLLNQYLLVTFTGYFQLIYGAILILIVLFMPNGIMGIIMGTVGKLKATKLIRRKELAKAPKMPP